jgi:hypothetical protein
VSFSNLFKEFKSSATWLQFPFVFEARMSRRGDTKMGHEWFGKGCLAPSWGFEMSREGRCRSRGAYMWSEGQLTCGHRIKAVEMEAARGWTLTLDTYPADLAGVAPPDARWTCLQLDLHDILLIYLSRHYGHLKSVRLCASLLVRNLYTSDLCFDPGESHSLPTLCVLSSPSVCAHAPSPQVLCLGAMLSLNSGLVPLKARSL